MQQLESAVETFQQVVPIEKPKQEGVEGIGVPCPVCGVYFDNQTSVRKHLRRKHPDYQMPEIKFDPAEHAIGGLPQCAACKHRFQSWQELKVHIEKGRCHEQDVDTREPNTGPTQDEQIQMFGYLLPGLSESNKRPPATPQQQSTKGEESGKAGGKATGLTITEVMLNLTEIEPLILESLVLRFHAPRKLKPTPETENKAVFKLEVSLRSTEADQLYQSLAKLENNAVWQLIGCQLRKDGMRRSNPVQELMKLLSQGGSTCWGGDNHMCNTMLDFTGLQPDACIQDTRVIEQVGDIINSIQTTLGRTLKDRSSVLHEVDVERMKALEWIDSEGRWVYRKCSPTQEALYLDQSRKPIPQTAFIEQLGQAMTLLARPENMPRFQSRELAPEMKGYAVTFHVDIGLRSEAEPLWQIFTTWVDLQAWVLGAVRIRPHRLKRPPAADRLSVWLGNH
ncbi:unnamed protein product [Symbiodinium sp. CCMP2592]|nr:unnamed protein product [Symbiodinium sp. CCMP2592]